MKQNILSILLFLLILGGILLNQAFFVVDETNQAITLQFGEPLHIIQEPGLNFKTPFIQNIIYFEKRILSSDAPPQEYLTSDKKRLVVDHVTRWRIQDPLTFFKAVRTETGARARLDDIVFSELRREVATVQFTDIIAQERENVMERVASSSAEKASEFGIDVVDVRVKRADLPAEVEQSVFNRMRAERERESSLFRAEGEEQANIIRAGADREGIVIRAEGEQEAQKLRGEGEAAAITIYAEALSQDLEFYAFSRRLEAYATILKRGDTVILPADSEFFKFLINNGLESVEEEATEE